MYTPEAQVPDILKAGLILFQKEILNAQAPIHTHLKSAILTQIRIEREGQGINRSAVKECVDVCLKLSVDIGGDSVYKRDIEPLVLKETEAFYTEEGSSLSASSSAGDYLTKVRPLPVQQAHHKLNSSSPHRSKAVSAKKKPAHTTTSTPKPPTPSARSSSRSSSPGILSPSSTSPNPGSTS